MNDLMMKKNTIGIFSSISLWGRMTVTLCCFSLIYGCGQQSQEGSVVTNSQLKDTATRKGATGAQAGAVAITLPMLDALFYEEGFEQDLKTQVQLSDAQLQKLKSAAHASVADLDERAADYYTSTCSAVKNSDEQLRSILGEEKAGMLAQWIGQRYAGADTGGLLPTTPNEVPKDTRIVVNAPGYRMDVFQDGKLLKTYVVGIGYPEFPLPAGIRRAENIIFNPTWTPPDEPWVKGKFSPGKQVEAGSKDNPLGPIKIPIGLPNLIHGGKAPTKLGGFASHGCVGLTNAGIQDFAATIAQLSGTTLTAEDVQGYGKQKSETKSVKLEKPIPIDLRYETIVAMDGALHVMRDVYERGTNTVDNARKVLNAYGINYDQLPEGEKQALLQALTEMNRDAQGHDIVENVAASGAATSGTDSGTNDDPTKSTKAKHGKVTSTIKGQKEIVVPIAALQGKGYPMPVNMVGGAQPKTQGTVSRR